jgi:hypothetical protein
MKIYWGVEVQPKFLTLALDGGEWSASCTSHFTLQNKMPVPTGQKAGWAPEPGCPACGLVTILTELPQLLNCKYSQQMMLASHSNTLPAREITFRPTDEEDDIMVKVVVQKYTSKGQAMN